VITYDAFDRYAGPPLEIDLDGNYVSRLEYVERSLNGIAAEGAHDA
jgi:hypothetical protein